MNFKTADNLTAGDTFTHGGNRYTVSDTPSPAEAVAYTSRPRVLVSTDKGMLRIPYGVPLKIVS